MGKKVVTSKLDSLVLRCGTVKHRFGNTRQNEAMNFERQQHLDTTKKRLERQGHIAGKVSGRGAREYIHRVLRDGGQLEHGFPKAEEGRFQSQSSLLKYGI